MSKIKISSNRNFGLVFFIVFLVISTWPLIHHESVRIWSGITSLIFLILGLMNSKLLTPLNKLWFKFGMILGAIVEPTTKFKLRLNSYCPFASTSRLFSSFVIGCLSCSRLVLTIFLNDRSICLSA